MRRALAWPLRPRRHLVVVLAGAVVVAGAGVGVVRLLGSEGALLPKVGADLRNNTQTCAKSKILGTAIVGRECARFVSSDPINVVISFNTRDPYEELTRHADPRWRPAQGDWKVQQGFSNESSKGCDDGWRDSTRQVELRIDKVTRRHFKMIYETCTQPDGHTVIFGGAHTDRYDVQRCGGDFAIDYDQSRDQLASSLRSLRASSVVTRQDNVPQQVPDGCGGSVHSDGAVVYVTLDG